ncbi:MAG: lamin tail domain-containing protein [Planctomycetota bacterium]
MKARRGRRLAMLQQLEDRRVLAAAPFSEDFSSFTGAGFESAPAAGQLDSDDWRVTGLSDGNGTFGGSHSTGDFARGTSGGGVSTGGIYAFDTGSNTILGVQPGGSDFTPGTITLEIENTSGSTINDWDISYDLFYNNNADRGNSLNFEFSTTDSSYTNVPALDFTTPETSDAMGWQSVSQSTTINAPVPAGGFLYVQWAGDDSTGGGSRDEYGIDNVSVSAAGGTQLSIAPLDAVKAEGDGGGTTPFTFEITRSGDTSGSSSVTWTKNDVDTDAADFSGTVTDSVTFLAGETTKTVTIDVNADATAESNEDFTVDLSGATGASISSGSATGTIQDDDTAISNAVINEFVFNHTGGDLDEYIEVFSAPSEDLSAYTVLVLDGSGSGTGEIIQALSLGVANASGYQYAGGAVLPGNTFTNGGDQSILLVRGFTGSVGDDLDTDDMGGLDVTPWSNLIDDVALYDGFSSDQVYSTTILSPDNMNDGNTFDVGGASRIANGVDTDSAADWRRNDFEGDGLPSFGGTFTTDPFEATNTPLAANTSVEPTEALIVVESGGTTDVTESGATDTFTIGFSTNPTAAVDVTVTPDSQLDLGAGPGVAIVLNYSNRLPQTVTVTAVDDAIVEAASHTGAITISTASVGDPAYDGLAGGVTATIADNDTPAPATFLNEFVLNHRGADVDDFVEVRSTPGAILSSLTVLAVDGDNGNGTVGRIVATGSFGTANAAGFDTFVFGNTLFDNMSLILVEGFTAAVNDDLDVDDDGIFDFDEATTPAGGFATAPWTAVRDAVSAADDGEDAFGLVQLSPSALNDGDSFSVGGASRIPDAAAATTAASEWLRNDFEGLGLPNYPFDTNPSSPGTALNTPGASNAIIAGLGVTETFGSTAVEEGAAGDTILLSLDGPAPTGNVTVTITPDAQLDLGSGAGVAITEVFTASAGPVSVAIDAVDDAVTEGAHSGVLSFEITASTDANYPVSTTAPDLTVDITDNEASSPSIVISEIMYNPASAEPDGEYVEIVNTGSSSVDIGGWVLDDEDTSDWGAIPAFTTLSAGQVAVIHNDVVASGTFRTEWGVPASALVIGVSWGSLANGPSSTSEILQLLDDSATPAVIDEVNYDDAGDWPTDNGTASIYLTDLASDNNVGTNWDLHDTTASPAQTPTPVNPSGPTFSTDDEGSPGLVPAIVSGASVVNVAPAANGFEAGTISGRFLVSLTAATASLTTVSYTLAGSATSPADYTAPSGSVDIPAGSLTAEIVLPVIDDAIFEGTETVDITLTGVTAGTPTLGTTAASIDLFDDETPTGFTPGDVIINEIMKDPSAVADGDGEYFEVYNTTASPIDINGWTISDLGTDSHTISNGGPLEVPANGYLVLGINSDSLTNGGVTVDYEYSGFTLGNGDDEVVLTDALATEIDRVEYLDATFPDVTGASLELLPSVLGLASPGTENDNPLNWQSSNTLIGAGPDFGTPGAVNSAPAPEINVTDDTSPTPLNIADGDATPSTADGTDFGATVIGTPVVSSFVIENDGADSLDVTAINFTGTDAADFSFSGLGLPVTIPANGSASFDVTFNPTTTGTKTATIEIINTDADEGTYDFALTGNATAALVPEITVESNFTEILDGDTTPDPADNTDFGSVDVAVGLASESYFITNDGTADLTISAINFTGAAAADYSVDAASISLPVVITPGNTVSFEVDFDPSATGARDATIEITSDDADENPYDYAITGNGVNATAATVLINEVDANTPGQDSDEFIELFGPGGTSLDGLVLVLFNGNGDVPYDAIDLDGQSIPADGYFVIGSASVPNVDLIEFTTDGVQNGADAVALYTGDASAIEIGTGGTAPTTTNLRDAIVYDTNDADDTGLLTGLGEATQFDEDANGLDDTESNSRVPDGLDASPFVAQTPTPGASNSAPSDTTPPTITDVKVAGTGWAGTFLTAVDPVDMQGLSMTGSGQLDNLPYVNLDTIYIQFSEDIGSFAAADIDVTGVNTATFTPTVTYSPATFQATISFAAPLSADKIELSILDGVVTDLAGNVLDGEWTESVSTVSGDGMAGGAFDFRLDVLPGDFDDSDGVSVGDVFGVNGLLFTTDIRADVDASGGVSVGDVFAVNGLLFTSLPTGSPAGTGGGEGESTFSTFFGGSDSKSDDGDGWTAGVDSVFGDLEDDLLF